MSLLRETFPVGPLACNCTILADDVKLEATVVDPGDDVVRIAAWLTARGMTLTQIVVTHAHLDHIAGAVALKRLTGALIFYSQRDLPLVAIMDQQAAWMGVALPEVTAPDADLPDLAQLNVGSHPMHTLLTPGHTQGSLCLHLPGEHLLLAGDTLFAGSVGRTDLPGGDARQLIRSIRERLLPLPDETVVVPGHGSLTTIGEEREFNPFLAAR